jgi:hypothetical protein
VGAENGLTPSTSAFVTKVLYPGNSPISMIGPWALRLAYLMLEHDTAQAEPAHEHRRPRRTIPVPDP